jgi:hypothetical protein
VAAGRAGVGEVHGRKGEDLVHQVGAVGGVADAGVDNVPELAAVVGEDVALHLGLDVVEEDEVLGCEDGGYGVVDGRERGGEMAVVVAVVVERGQGQRV